MTEQPETKALTSADAPQKAVAPAFSFSHVGVVYGQSEALHDVTLDIREGEHVAIIGPSGAGKTTALRLMAGVLWPSSGKVLALGRDTSKLRGTALRGFKREVGLIHQSDNLIPSLRVVHNVLMGRVGRWSPWRALLSLLIPQEMSRARDALRIVELEDRLWALPDELSGGQQQRVAIARLLVQQPRAILADEPVSQLDLRLGRDVIRLLDSIARRSGATLVVNLHTLDLLGEGHFDRVIALKEGRVFWQGAPHALTREVLRDLYGAEYRTLHFDDDGGAP
ncbi:MAG: ATP-binding cassette domain-containing protein [Planctomycetes bacterium]|nr:ATP-binding cassette domain-containing protein [Planctomycetota bacterium]